VVGSGEAVGGKGRKKKGTGSTIWVCVAPKKASNQNGPFGKAKNQRTHPPWGKQLWKASQPFYENSNSLKGDANKPIWEKTGGEKRKEEGLPRSVGRTMARNYLKDSRQGPR